MAEEEEDDEPVQGPGKSRRRKGGRGHSGKHVANGKGCGGAKAEKGAKVGKAAIPEGKLRGGAAVRAKKLQERVLTDDEYNLTDHEDVEMSNEFGSELTNFNSKEPAVKNGMMEEEGEEVPGAGVGEDEENNDAMEPAASLEQHQRVAADKGKGKGPQVNLISAYYQKPGR